MKIYYKNNIQPIGFYAGIGSRKTPQSILNVMFKIGQYLGNNNYCLRSGGAIGADVSFENGCDSVKGSKEIYYTNDANEILIDFVKDYHPNFDRLKEYHKKLHARNVLQIFGHDILNKSKFVICWTPDGYGNNPNVKRSKISGGTATAIDIALDNKIPVYNLGYFDYKYVINEIKKIIKGE